MMRAQTNQSHTTHQGHMRVVVIDKDQATIEAEIERHVKVIRSLIQRLTPSDRQKYFDGLLAHILDEPAGNQWSRSSNAWKGQDYGNLTIRELSLLEELSEKMEEMYRIMDNEIHN